RGYRSN
ncbi:hypothetical protein S40293_11617, partial [Stachybotrys chartarum IBT 40293]